jgi:hypothetical protein
MVVVRKEVAQLPPVLVADNAGDHFLLLYFSYSRDCIDMTPERPNSGARRDGRC